MSKSILSIALLLSLPCFSMAIKDKHIMRFDKGQEALTYGADGFSLGGKRVPSYDVSPEIRHVKPELLKAYLKTGYLELKKRENLTKIIAHQRANGGGPIFGTIAAIGVGIVGAATTLVASVAAIPATGPGFLAVATAGITATTTAMTYTAIAVTALPTI